MGPVSISPHENPCFQRTVTIKQSPLTSRTPESKILLKPKERSKMICKHCLKDVRQYALLGYCAQCGVWYKAEGEEIKGVYMLCSTKEDNPEKCNLVVQNLFIGAEELPESGEKPIATSRMPNVRKADKICVSCANKHFVL
jgi:hypothetical protein